MVGLLLLPFYRLLLLLLLLADLFRKRERKSSFWIIPYFTYLGFDVLFMYFVGFEMFC